MRRVLLELDLFQSGPDRQLSEQALRHMLEALTLANQAYIRRHPNAPNPFQARIPYAVEPPGQERWKAIPYALRSRTLDCEDLAAWLTAWLREKVPGMQGAETIPLPPKAQGNTLVYHIVTRLPDGRIIDPSRGLGMKAA